MSTDAMFDEISEHDYVRKLVRNPPSLSDAAAHLVWVRLMTPVLVGLEEWAPHATTALVAHYRSLEGFRPYCESGGYERAFVDQVPHALSFLEWLMATREAMWLKDIVRCETWASCLQGKVASEHHARLRELLRIEDRQGTEYAVVSHDVLETLQHLVGYADTTMNRAGRLLWFLGVPPIFPVQRAAPRPGVVIFRAPGGDVEMSYLPVEEN